MRAQHSRVSGTEAGTSLVSTLLRVCPAGCCDFIKDTQEFGTRFVDVVFREVPDFLHTATRGADDDSFDGGSAATKKQQPNEPWR